MFQNLTSYQVVFKTLWLEHLNFLVFKKICHKQVLDENKNQNSKFFKIKIYASKVYKEITHFKILKYILVE